MSDKEEITIGHNVGPTLEGIAIEHNVGPTLEEIKNKQYFSTECDIENAKALILPYENFREGYDILYPENTKELLRYFESNGFKIDVPCSENDYKEIELHDSLIDLGIFLLNSAFLPIFLNLISSFLYDKFKKKGKDPSEAEAKIVINIEENKSKSIRFEYKGTAKGLVDSLKQIEKISKND